ncbi:hypothetical protein ONZ45_g3428 [Pleurotus djamor]|nr:hypothetical protein ONZ45_g3428 [Pleurotus djamor]
MRKRNSTAFVARFRSTHASKTGSLFLSLEVSHAGLFPTWWELSENILQARRTSHLNFVQPVSYYIPSLSVKMPKSLVKLDHKNAHQEEEARSHQELPFSRYLNKLTPPYGTLGFSLQSGYKPIWGPVSYAGHNYLYLQWSIDAYVYVVGAFPDENFATNGGAVYVALVHSGSARSGSTVGPLYEYRYTVTPTLTGLKPITQLPLSGTGVVQGDTTNYPIVFNQDMQMFRQNGTEAFTFPAQYENNIGLDDGIQIGGIQGSGVQWGTIMKSLPSSTLFPFGSFSLFRVDSIKSSISFECMVSIYKHQDGSTREPTHITSQSKTIQVDIPLFNVAQRQRTSKL